MKKIILLIGIIGLLLINGCDNVKEPCKITIYSDGEVIFSSNCNPNNLTFEYDLSEIPDNATIENATFRLVTK